MIFYYSYKDKIYYFRTKSMFKGHVFKLMFPNSSALNNYNLL